MPRPITATIHLPAIRHNLAQVRGYAKHAKIWAVVKANAYGHGIEHVLPALNTADGFGLLDLTEAFQLRQLGWNGPILLLEGFFATEDLKLVESHSLSTMLHSEEQLRMLETTPLKRPVSVQLKMNTGMNRLGFPPKDFKKIWTRLRAIPWVGAISLATHFANAECTHEGTVCNVSSQKTSFDNATQDLPGERCLANSAAILYHPNTHADWVRPGIILYGGLPLTQPSQENPLKPYSYPNLQPAMTLQSEIIAIQNIKAGEAVGYGSTFIAKAPMRIGVVACGYADGYPRHAPTGAPILVDNLRTTIVGRISMDMMNVDLTLLPEAHIGSRVTLWGEGLSIDEVATKAGTVGYELMCALAKRVPVQVEA